MAGRRAHHAVRARALRRRRGARTAALLVSMLVLVGAPVLVVLLASTESVTAGAPQVRPGSTDALRPTAPFFRNAGDGVRPAGIGCSGAGPRAVLAQAHLDVFADGARVTVPAGIGVLPTCRYWLSTSRSDGIVVIASPERRVFTLGDLFDIWGAPIGRSEVLSFPIGDVRRLRVFVDGRRATGDPRAIRLRPQREIALVIGRAPAAVPSRFRFPPTP